MRQHFTKTEDTKVGVRRQKARSHEITKIRGDDVRQVAGAAGHLRSERCAEAQTLSHYLFVFPRIFLIAARSAGGSHSVMCLSLKPTHEEKT